MTEVSPVYESPPAPRRRRPRSEEVTTERPTKKRVLLSSPKETPSKMCKPLASPRRKPRALSAPPAAAKELFTPTNTKASQKCVTLEKETDERRLAQRRKEVAYGKNTLGYDRYLRDVPKAQRAKGDPRTPDVTMKASKRQFDGIVRAWRRRLHEWDPPTAAGLANPLVVVDEKKKEIPPQVAEDKQHPSVLPQQQHAEDDDGLGPPLFAAALEAKGDEPDDAPTEDRLPPKTPPPPKKKKAQDDHVDSDDDLL